MYGLVIPPSGAACASCNFDEQEAVAAADVEQLAPAVAEQIIDDDPTPEDQVVRNERQLHGRRLLSELGDEQQVILSLRFAAELTSAEIAVVTGRREDAVKKIAYRTLELLRERNSHV
jgi:RNA polymerase sigma factor (sigma-70 family)